MKCKCMGCGKDITKWMERLEKVRTLAKAHTDSTLAPQKCPTPHCEYVYE